MSNVIRDYQKENDPKKPKPENLVVQPVIETSDSEQESTVPPLSEFLELPPNAMEGFEKPETPEGEEPIPTLEEFYSPSAMEERSAKIAEGEYGVAPQSKTFQELEYEYGGYGSNLIDQLGQETIDLYQQKLDELAPDPNYWETSEERWKRYFGGMTPTERAIINVGNTRQRMQESFIKQSLFSAGLGSKGVLEEAGFTDFDPANLPQRGDSSAKWWHIGNIGARLLSGLPGFENLKMTKDEERELIENDPFYYKYANGDEFAPTVGIRRYAKLLREKPMETISATLKQIAVNPYPLIGGVFEGSQFGEFKDGWLGATFYGLTKIGGLGEASYILAKQNWDIGMGKELPEDGTLFTQWLRGRDFSFSAEIKLDSKGEIINPWSTGLSDIEKQLGRRLETVESRAEYSKVWAAVEWKINKFNEIAKKLGAKKDNVLLTPKDTYIQPEAGKWFDFAVGFVPDIMVGNVGDEIVWQLFKTAKKIKTHGLKKTIQADVASVKNKINQVLPTTPTKMRREYGELKLRPTPDYWDVAGKVPENKVPQSPVYYRETKESADFIPDPWQQEGLEDLERDLWEDTTETIFDIPTEKTSDLKQLPPSVETPKSGKAVFGTDDNNIQVTTVYVKKPYVLKPEDIVQASNPAQDKLTVFTAKVDPQTGAVTRTALKDTDIPSSQSDDVIAINPEAYAATPSNRTSSLPEDFDEDFIDGKPIDDITMDDIDDLEEFERLVREEFGQPEPPTIELPGDTVTQKKVFSAHVNYSEIKAAYDELFEEARKLENALTTEEILNDPGRQVLLKPVPKPFFSDEIADMITSLRNELHPSFRIVSPRKLQQTFNPATAPKIIDAVENVDDIYRPFTNPDEVFNAIQSGMPLPEIISKSIRTLALYHGTKTLTKNEIYNFIGKHNVDYPTFSKAFVEAVQNDELLSAKFKRAGDEVFSDLDPDDLSDIPELKDLGVPDTDQPFQKVEVGQDVEDVELTSNLGTQGIEEVEDIVTFEGQQVTESLQDLKGQIFDAQMNQGIEPPPELVAKAVKAFLQQNPNAIIDDVVDELEFVDTSQVLEVIEQDDLLSIQDDIVSLAEPPRVEAPQRPTTIQDTAPATTDVGMKTVDRTEPPKSTAPSEYKEVGTGRTARYGEEGDSEGFELSTKQQAGEQARKEAEATGSVRVLGNGMDFTIRSTGEGEFTLITDGEQIKQALPKKTPKQLVDAGYDTSPPPKDFKLPKVFENADEKIAADGFYSLAEGTGRKRLNRILKYIKQYQDEGLITTNIQEVDDLTPELYEQVKREVIQAKNKLTGEQLQSQTYNNRLVIEQFMSSGRSEFPAFRVSAEKGEKGWINIKFLDPADKAKAWYLNKTGMLDGIPVNVVESGGELVPNKPIAKSATLHGVIPDRPPLNPANMNYRTMTPEDIFPGFFDDLPGNTPVEKAQLILKALTDIGLESPQKFNALAKRARMLNDFTQDARLKDFVNRVTRLNPRSENFIESGDILLQDFTDEVPLRSLKDTEFTVAIDMELPHGKTKTKKTKSPEAGTVKERELTTYRFTAKEVVNKILDWFHGTRVEGNLDLNPDTFFSHSGKNTFGVGLHLTNNKAVADEFAGASLPGNVPSQLPMSETEGITHIIGTRFDNVIQGMGKKGAADFKPAIKNLLVQVMESMPEFGESLSLQVQLKDAINESKTIKEMFELVDVAIRNALGVDAVEETGLLFQRMVSQVLKDLGFDAIYFSKNRVREKIVTVLNPEKLVVSPSPFKRTTGGIVQQKARRVNVDNWTHGIGGNDATKSDKYNSMVSLANQTTHEQGKVLETAKRKFETAVADEATETAEKIKKERIDYQNRVNKLRDDINKSSERVNQRLSRAYDESTGIPRTLPEPNTIKPKDLKDPETIRTLGGAKRKKFDELTTDIQQRIRRSIEFFDKKRSATRNVNADQVRRQNEINAQLEVKYILQASDDVNLNDVKISDMESNYATILGWMFDKFGLSTQLNKAGKLFRNIHDAKGFAQNMIDKMIRQKILIDIKKYTKDANTQLKQFIPDKVLREAFIKDLIQLSATPKLDEAYQVLPGVEQATKRQYDDLLQELTSLGLTPQQVDKLAETGFLLHAKFDEMKMIGNALGLNMDNLAPLWDIINPDTQRILNQIKENKEGLKDVDYWGEKISKFAEGVFLSMKRSTETTKLVAGDYELLALQLDMSMDELMETIDEGLLPALIDKIAETNKPLFKELVKYGALAKIPIPGREIAARVVQEYGDRLPFRMHKDIMINDPVRLAQAMTDYLEINTAKANVTRKIVNDGFDLGWVISDADYKKLPKKNQNEWVQVFDSQIKKYYPNYLGTRDSIWMRKPVFRQWEASLELATDLKVFNNTAEIIYGLSRFLQEQMLLTGGYVKRVFWDTTRSYYSAGGDIAIMFQAGVDLNRVAKGGFDVLDNTVKRYRSYITGEILTKREFYEECSTFVNLNTVPFIGRKQVSSDGNILYLAKMIPRGVNYLRNVWEANPTLASKLFNTASAVFEGTAENQSVLFAKLAAAAGWAESSAKWGNLLTWADTFPSTNDSIIFNGVTKLRKPTTVDEVKNTFDTYYTPWNFRPTLAQRSRSLVPFLTFSLWNQPAQIRQVIRRPEEFRNYSRIIRTLRAGNQNEDDNLYTTREHILDSGAIAYGKDPYGNPMYFYLGGADSRYEMLTTPYKVRKNIDVASGEYYVGTQAEKYRQMRDQTNTMGEFLAKNIPVLNLAGVVAGWSLDKGIKLEERAEYDKLTGLPNKLEFILREFPVAGRFIRANHFNMIGTPEIRDAQGNVVIEPSRGWNIPFLSTDKRTDNYRSKYDDKPLAQEIMTHLGFSNHTADIARNIDMNYTQAKATYRYLDRRMKDNKTEIQRAILDGSWKTNPKEFVKDVMDYRKDFVKSSFMFKEILVYRFYIEEKNITPKETLRAVEKGVHDWIFDKHGHYIMNEVEQEVLKHALNDREINEVFNQIPNINNLLKELE